MLPSVPSLSALRKLPGGAAATRPFFGMGDPVLEGPDPTDRQRGAKRRSASAPARFYRNGLADIRAVRELTPLPDTADELETIAKVLGASPDAVNLREAASETRGQVGRRSASIASSSSPPTASSPATSPGLPSRPWC